MRSPFTTIPAVTITASAGGWMVACSCGAERWCVRRPGADRYAHEHRQSHAPKRGE